MIIYRKHMHDKMTSAEDRTETAASQPVPRLALGTVTQRSFPLYLLPAHLSPSRCDYLLRRHEGRCRSRSAATSRYVHGSSRTRVAAVWLRVAFLIRARARKRTWSKHLQLHQEHHGVRQQAVVFPCSCSLCLCLFVVLLL